MILSSKQITKALISLRECAGWSAPLLFANHRRPVSRDEAQIMADKKGGDQTAHMHGLVCAFVVLIRGI